MEDHQESPSDRPRRGAGQLDRTTETEERIFMMKPMEPDHELWPGSCQDWQKFDDTARVEY